MGWNRSAPPRDSWQNELTRDLFGNRGAPAVAMAKRSLELAIDPDQIVAVCINFTAELIEATH